MAEDWELLGWGFREWVLEVAGLVPKLLPRVYMFYLGPVDASAGRSKGGQGVSKPCLFRESRPISNAMIVFDSGRWLSVKQGLRPMGAKFEHRKIMGDL